MITTTEPQGRHAGVRRSVDAWSAAGIISPEQAEHILQFEAAADVSAVPTRPARRVPLVAEALGYLGGILGIVGLVLLVARYWPDLAVGGRLALAAGGATALMVAGWLVHEEAGAAPRRLRWFLWLVSSAAAGLFAVVLGDDVLDLRPSRVMLTVAITLAAQNAVLWEWRTRPVQQLLALGASAFAVGLAMVQWSGDGAAGLTLLAAAAVLVVAGWQSFTPTPMVTAGVGGIAALSGAMLVANTWQTPGLLVLVATCVGLLALAGQRGGTTDMGVRVTLTVVGTIGALQSLPATIGFYAEHAGLTTGLAVWMSGATLVWVGGQRLLRVPLLVEAVGGVLIVAGAAITGVQWEAFAPLFGLITAITFIVLATVPGRVLMSLFGSIGLLVNVPWAITYYFPGEGRAPLLILASGAVIVAVAVWLARMGGRFRSELRS